MKYKNKDGIELNYTGLRGDYHTSLVKEVIGEAIKILKSYNRFNGRSVEWSLHRGVSFLEDNFDIEDRSDGWRISQFNRNRDKEDQVSTIEELEKRIDEISNS